MCCQYLGLDFLAPSINWAFCPILLLLFGPCLFRMCFHNSCKIKFRPSPVNEAALVLMTPVPSSFPGMLPLRCPRCHGEARRNSAPLVSLPSLYNNKKMGMSYPAGTGSPWQLHKPENSAEYSLGTSEPRRRMCKKSQRRTMTRVHIPTLWLWGAQQP